MVSPILLALDFPTVSEAHEMASVMAPHVGGFKVGLALLLGEGRGAIQQIARLGLPVFADAKLHDIPNTVEAAARALAGQGARWVTVHAGGGRRMVEAAVGGLGDGLDGRPAGVLVVTVLTSLDDGDLRATGVSRAVGDQVAAMADLAANAGAEGVICPPAAIGRVKEVAPQLTVVVPGLRIDDDWHDQKQVGSPLEALAAGADYLVMGRAITRAADPLLAVARALA
ncbi:MAG: orotidine-5'-phosphate decarboxylase [Acidimicrobiia bacterium]